MSSSNLSELNNIEKANQDYIHGLEYLQTSCIKCRFNPNYLDAIPYFKKAAEVYRGCGQFEKEIQAREYLVRCFNNEKSYWEEGNEYEKISKVQLDNLKSPSDAYNSIDNSFNAYINNHSYEEALKALNKSYDNFMEKESKKEAEKVLDLAFDGIQNYYHVIILDKDEDYSYVYECIDKYVDFLFNEEKYDKCAELCKKSVELIEKENKNKHEQQKLYQNLKKIEINLSPNNINESLIDFDKLKVNPNLVCIDLIYNPYNSKFLIDAKKHGYKAYNGIDMLIYQAIYSYYFINESYHNYIYDDKLIDKIRKNIDYRNVIIIGMPFSGKTTYGKQYALDNNLELFDIDEIIEKKYGKINDIFENYGEEYFRNIEKSVIKELSKKNNSVIVPGGGAIIDNDNLINLKSNGYFIFLDTDIDDLIDRSKNDTTRPLVKNKEDLIKLYNERHKIYLNCADIVIKNK